MVYRTGHINCSERSTLLVKVRTKAWVGLPIDIGEDRLTKRVGLRGRGEGSDWLGPYTGPHTKEVWTESRARLATRIRSLMGKVTHLCRGY